MSGKATDLRKLREGRDEPIIDPDLPIVDAHHHLYDRPSFRYLLDEFLDDVGAGHNITATVYIETKEMARPDGPEPLRPIGEIEFANGVAAMSHSGRYGPCRVAAAIVGYADLAQGDAVAEVLDRAMSTAPDRFRGIRMTTLEAPNDAWLRYVIMPHRPVHGLLTSPGFRAGFRHLAPRQLTYEASVFHNQLGDVADLANDYPDTTIVLGHMGMAMGLDLDEQGRAEVFREWRRNLGRLGEQSNVVCKIGGLGLPFWGLKLEERADPVGYAELAELWKPYVEAAIETFGVGRCLMESNFPPDGRSCGYVPLWNALKHITRDFTAGERLAMFHDNSTRVYRIEPTGTRQAPESQRDMARPVVNTSSVGEA